MVETKVNEKKYIYNTKYCLDMSYVRDQRRKWEFELVGEYSALSLLVIGAMFNKCLGSH